MSGIAIIVLTCKLGMYRVFIGNCRYKYGIYVAIIYLQFSYYELGILHVSTDSVLCFRS
jgi:hypothetical protein